MEEQPPSPPDITVCALAGCDEAVTQPPRGGRRRLYCSNAHRAEARRQRLAHSPDADAVDVVDSLLDQLDTVVGGLRRHHTQLRSIDPARQAVEVARIRAEATQQVLAAQQAAAAAAEEASRVGQELAAKRSAWQARRSDLEAEVTTARTEADAAGGAVNAVRDELAQADAAHRHELAERDQAAARAASTHQGEISDMAEELEQARVTAATASARAESADRCAAAAEEAARSEADRAARADTEVGRLQTEMAASRAEITAVMLRAEAAEALSAQARADLVAERDRHDLRLGELHDQLAQLLARQPGTRSGARTPRPTTANARGTAGAGRGRARATKKS